MTAAPEVRVAHLSEPRTRAPRSRARRREGFAALWFLLPFLVIYAVFLVYPFFKGIWISLHDWDLMDDNIRIWIGGQNYQFLWEELQNPSSPFRRAIINTLYFVILTVPTMTVLSLLLALAVSGGGRVRAICRSIFFLSSVFSVTVVTLIWGMVLSVDKGLVAPFFRMVGADPINFLGSPTWAMPSIALATLWWGVGLPMALFLAALGSIPRELYEAAELDHASRWTTFWRITLPAIRHTVVLVLVLQIVGQFQVFGQAQLMTNGGPAGATRTLVLLIYDTAFRDWYVGEAAAIALALFGMMLVFSALQLWLGRQGDES